MYLNHFKDISKDIPILGGCAEHLCSAVIKQRKKIVAINDDLHRNNSTLSTLGSSLHKAMVQNIESIANALDMQEMEFFIGLMFADLKHYSSAENKCHGCGIKTCPKFENVSFVGQDEIGRKTASIITR